MENIDETLPQELVIEILSRLPIKHLSPLKFVSKSWLQLLTKNPQFAKLLFDRFKKSNPNPSIIAFNAIVRSLFLATEFESCDKALTIQLPFYEANTHYLFGHCNGLLCFHHLYDHDQVYIWNPLTNDHITIPCLPVPSSRSPGYGTRTGFEFGFEEDSNVYKLVRFFTEIDFAGVSVKTWTQISVYTIGIDSMWRTVQVDLPGLIPRSTRIPPLVNGVLHWITGSRDVIFTFDLKREVIGELLPPPCGIKFDKIVELGGLLCVVDNTSMSEMRVWVMKEYGLVSSWSKQYIIAKQECFDDMVPLGFTHNGEIIMEKNSRNLSLYSPETNTVKDLIGFREEFFLPYAYMGSIISPTVISRAGQNLLEEES